MPISTDLLSNELRVATEIHAATVEGKEPVHFNSLVARLKDVMARATVSRSLDMLFDQGVVKAEWVQRADGRHVRQLSIAGENQEFVKRIYEKVQGAQKAAKGKK